MKHSQNTPQEVKSLMMIQQGNERFNYRVAGVAIQDGHVLLCRSEKNQYWVFPGGHPEMMESSPEALAREVKEEAGSNVKVQRLLWVVENFFVKKSRFHELGFYFLMQFPQSSPALSREQFEGVEGDHRLFFQWHPLDEKHLQTLPLQPAVLAAEVLKLPEHPLHLVFQDI